MTNDVVVIAIVKNGERFITLYRDNQESKTEALKSLSRLAANPELSFNWRDAAVLARKIREGVS